MAFAGFNFEADGEKPAVIANSDAAASTLGYTTVEDTRIAHMRVLFDDTVVWKSDIGEGKYRSAIFVEAMMAYRGNYNWEQVLLMDAVAYLALRDYMGATVCHEAIKFDGDKHAFVHALLTAENSGFSVRVQVEWKFVASL